jgi:WD40 repeat protein
METDGGIEQMIFDPLDRDLLIASQAYKGHPGHVRILALNNQRTYHWTEITAPAHNLAYAPDGNTLGFVCSDGSTWLYSMTKDAWAYANDERSDTLTAAFSADGRRFVTSDRHGAVIVRDVASSFDHLSQ